jgi:hypothetical protein
MEEAENLRNSILYLFNRFKKSLATFQIIKLLQVDSKFSVKEIKQELEKLKEENIIKKIPNEGVFIIQDYIWILIEK